VLRTADSPPPYWRATISSAQHRCAALPPGDGGLWPKGRLDLLLGGPPVRPLDFTDPLPDDRLGRRDVVQTAGIGPQELGLVGDGQGALLHRLDGPPGIITVVVI